MAHSPAQSREIFLVATQQWNSVRTSMVLERRWQSTPPNLIAMHTRPALNSSSVKTKLCTGSARMEEGYANLRGHSRELYQQNMKAVVPHLVSTQGYGILLDCGSAMTFHDDALGSYWWADCVDELDFYFIYGATFDGVIQRYRLLTGTTPLPPKRAFGYIQSKERYVTATEIVDVVAEHRRRRIPLDVIVLELEELAQRGRLGPEVSRSTPLSRSNRVYGAAPCNGCSIDGLDLANRDWRLRRSGSAFETRSDAGKSIYLQCVSPRSARLLLATSPTRPLPPRSRCMVV